MDKKNDNNNNEKDNLNFNVPDTISMEYLNNLVNSKKSNKEKRINEILKRMQLPKTLDNMAKAERVIERRVEMGYMTSDYELISEEEKGYANGTLTQQQSRSNKDERANGFKQFLKKLVSERDEGIDNFLENLFSDDVGQEENCILAKVNGRTLIIPVSFIASILDDYEQLKNQELPAKVKNLSNKTDLSDDEAEILIEFFAEDEDFSKFVISKRMRG